MTNSCNRFFQFHLKQNTTTSDNSFTGTFKLKTFKINETISSSTTDYPYTVTHIVTDNYSYFGHTISNDGDNYSRTVFGKVVFSYDGRDNMTIDCDGHQKSYKNKVETSQFCCKEIWQSM